MIVVISPLLNDTIVKAFAGWSQTTEIALLTVKDMMSEGWELYSDRFEDSFFVTKGKQCAVNQIGGVINLLPFIYEKELIQIKEEDRSYVASELTAMMTYFLTKLSCKTINRPDAESLMGSSGLYYQWKHLITKLGIPVQIEVGKTPTALMYIVGDSVLNEQQIPYEAEVRLLAKQLNTSYLEVRFVQTDHTWYCVAVSKMINLTHPGVMDLLRHFFVES